MSNSSQLDISYISGWGTLSCWLIIFSFDKNTEKEFWQKKICIIQELYLRSFDDDAMLKKRWFLFSPESVLVNIEKFPEKLNTKKVAAKKRGLL